MVAKSPRIFHPRPGDSELWLTFLSLSQADLMRAFASESVDFAET